MGQYNFIKHSMPSLVARGANILQVREKVSRRPTGAISSVLQRLGLQAPPPTTNVGRGVARGLLYGGLAAPVAAYGGARAAGLSDEDISEATGRMFDTAAGGLSNALGLKPGLATPRYRSEYADVKGREAFDARTESEMPAESTPAPDVSDPMTGGYSRPSTIKRDSVRSLKGNDRQRYFDARKPPEPTLLGRYMNLPEGYFQDEAQDVLTRGYPDFLTSTYEMLTR